MTEQQLWQGSGVGLNVISLQVTQRRQRGKKAIDLRSVTGNKKGTQHRAVRSLELKGSFCSITMEYAGYPSRCVETL